MPAAAKSPWQMMTMVSTVMAILLGASHFIGLPSCNDYMTKVEAKDDHRTYEDVHKETMEAIHALAIQNGRMEERIRAAQ